SQKDPFAVPADRDYLRATSTPGGHMNSTRVLLAASVLGAFHAASRSFADDQLGDKLGTVRFELTGTPDAKAHVVRGVKLLHHMMYPEADREFAQAVKADPSCQMAYWGRAMTLIHPLWPDAPTDAERAKGAEYVRAGIACPPTTPRERAYLEVMNR